MGTRGPAPTPTAVLRLRDSTLVRKRTKQGEPQPERGVPARPHHVTKESRAVWSAVTRMLDQMQVLTVADGGQLERYCLMFVQWRQLQRVIARFSDTDDLLVGSLKNDATRPILRNTWAEAHRLDGTLRQIETQFGLTPAARARLSCLVSGAQEAVAEDDLESLFFSGAG